MEEVRILSRKTDRMRGGNAFIETRTSAYYIKMGFLAGQGRSPNFIAEALGDGIDPSYVRTALKRAGYRRREAFCEVPLTYQQRAWLEYKAEKEGVSPEEWLRRRVVGAVLGLPAKDAESTTE